VATLKVLKGTNVGQCYELPAGEAVIGRYPFCEIVLPSHTISRQHARLTLLKGNYYIEDLGSLNGTFLNGDRVRKRTPLRDQDRIRVYETLLIFYEKEPAEDVVLAEESPSAAATTETQSFTPSNPTPPEIPAVARQESSSAPQKLATVSALDLNSGAVASPAAQKKLRSVIQRSASLAGITSIEEILNKFLDVLLEVMPQAERGHILLEESAGGPVVPKASKHRNDETIASLNRGALNEQIVKGVVTSGEAVLVQTNGASDDEDSVLGDEGCTIACVPLLGPSRRPLGLLCLEGGRGSEEERQFDESDLHLLISVGCIMGQAVECARLFSSAAASSDSVNSS